MDTRTGSRDKDWTLHQVLAHLVSIARLLNRAAEAVTNGQPLHVDGLSPHYTGGYLCA